MGNCCPRAVLETQAEFSGELQMDLEPTSPYSIMVRWAEPPGVARFYKIRYRRADKSAYDKVRPRRGQTELLLTGLKSGVTYEVGICDKSQPPEQQNYNLTKFARTLLAHSPERQPLLS